MRNNEIEALRNHSAAYWMIIILIRFCVVTPPRRWSVLAGLPSWSVAGE